MTVRFVNVEITGQLCVDRVCKIEGETKIDALLAMIRLHTG